MFYPLKPLRLSHVLALLLTLALTACQSARAEDQTGDAHRHAIIAADYSTGRIAWIDAAGETVWEGQVRGIHDLHLLPNGNILFQDSMTHLLEVDPATNETVWEYDATTTNRDDDQRFEIHAFQRLKDGTTMIVESGPGRIIEVDREGNITHEIGLQRDHPDAHSDTRLVRKLDNGHYLVCHERDGAVREYDADGAVVWDYDVPLFGRERAGGHGPEAFGNQTFAALRLDNGNTLIATGNGHSVIEVTPDYNIAWHLTQHELEGITLAWVTTLQVLPNGNIVIGNCHAGPDNPQVIEITRDKEVVWTFHDFERFGNALSNSQVVGEAAEPYHR
ncbi:MAG: PQQ-binding-like beta-propeller repeat protein [Phycisphaerales bacterium JB063]